MPISVGERLPDAVLLKVGHAGHEQVDLAGLLAGRKVVIFAVPGAFTPTCHTGHMPSFVRTAADLADRGIDEIFCVSVNDPFVMQAWGEATGAFTAGITLLADSDSAFAGAIGMAFDYPPDGLLARSMRYAMLVEDGVVKVLNAGDKPGQCSIASGETMLEGL